MTTTKLKILYLSLFFITGFFALPLFASADSVSQILTPTGYKNISEVKVGDQVSAYDFESGKNVVNTIERIDVVSDSTYQYQDPYNFYLINNTYKLWKNQSVWRARRSLGEGGASQRLVHVFELKVQDNIYDENLKEIKITSIKKIKDPKQWYEFIISGSHSYIQDGLQFHNASRYWVGGGSTANWSATGNTNWSATSNGSNNASVPTTTTDVFFDGVGGGASDSTLSADITIRSLDMTGYLNTLTHNANVTLSIGDGTTGANSNALIFSGVYLLGSATSSAISFISTSVDQQTINFSSATVGNITFNASSNGSWILTSGFSTDATATVTLTKGTFNTNGYTLYIGKLNSSSGFVRSLTLGNSAINIAGVGTAWNLDATNLTFSGSTSAIYFNGTDSTFAGGDQTYGAVIMHGSGSVTITGVNTFNQLDRTASAVKTDSLILSADQTVTYTFALSGSSTTTDRLLVKSSTLGTARTITNTGVISNWQNVDLQDITLVESYDCSAITGLCGDAGGNSGITFTTAQTNYWVGGAGNWSTSAEWASSSGGSADSGRVPLPQDNATFDANSFSAGSQTVTADMPRIGKTIVWTGATNTPTWDISASSGGSGIAGTMYGSLTLISGMTITADTDDLVFEGRSSYTITSATKTLGDVTEQMIGGTLTLSDNFICGGIFTLNNGTFNANNNNFTAYNTLSSSNSNTRTITMGSGTWTFLSIGNFWDTSTTTGLTLTANTSTIKVTSTSNSSTSFYGGGKTYNNIWFSRGSSTGSNSLTGSNTFADFKDDGSAAHSILFTAGTTTTVTTFTVSGTAGNLISINSDTTATHALVKSGGGTISSDYLNIQHSVATPSSTWYAGTHSTDNQANTNAGSGWVFTAVPCNRYWVGSGSSANWSATGNTNWATSSNGSNNASVPDSTCDVFFDGVGGGASNSTLSANITINSLDMTGYVNTLTHNSSVTLTVGGGGVTFKLASGMTYTLGSGTTSAITFTGTSGTTAITTNGKTVGNITFNGSGGTFELQGALTTSGNLTITAGTLDTKSGTNSAISVGGNWSNAGTFTARSGTVTFNATATGKTITTGGSSFYDLTFDGSGGGWTLQDATTVSDVLTITTGTLNGGSVTLTLSGTTGTPFPSSGGTFTASTGTVAYTGNNSGGNTTINQNVTYYNVTINNASETYVLAGSTALNNNLTITAGTLDAVSTYTLNVGGNWSNAGTFTARTSLVNLNSTSAGATLTSGGSAFYDIQIQGSGGTYTLQDDLTASYNLVIASGSTLNASSRTITLAGTDGIPFHNSGTFTASTSTVIYTGNNSGGNTTVKNLTYYNLTVNNASETYELGGNTTANNNLTITAGILDAVTGSGYSLTVGGNWSNAGTFTARVTTVTLTSTSGSATITSGGSSFYKLTQNGSGGTYTLQDALDVDNNLTITAGTLDTKSGSNYAITLAGNWSNSGTFTARSGTVTLDGTDQSITGTTTFYNLTKQEATNNSSDQTLTFTHTTTYTISNTFNLDGLDSNDELKLVSSSAGTKFTLDLTSAATANYLDVKDSQTSTSSATCTSCTNAGGNDDGESAPHWIFASPTYDQKHFRFYSDNLVPAGLNTANPLAAEDTNYDVGIATTFRLRIETANTGTVAGSITRRLEFKEDSGSWTQITTGTNNVRLSNSSNFTDGDATTSRLTAVGTFMAGQGKDTGSDTSSISLTNAYNTEDEYSLILQSGAAGHAYTFRITNAGVALDTYTVTPAINTPDATAPVPSSFNPATSSTIRTATPTITYSLDEPGDCKASTTNASYDSMSGADCTGDGSSAGSCTMPSLGSNGSKTIYFACQDVWSNKDTSLTTHSVTYTLTLSSGLTPTFNFKGGIRVKGNTIFK